MVTRSRTCRVPALFAHRSFISVDNSIRRARLANRGSVNPHNAMTEAAYRIKLMADEDDGAALLGDVAHFAHALFLKVDVAHRQHFVDQQNLRLQMRGHRES